VTNQIVVRNLYDLEKRIQVAKRLWMNKKKPHGTQINTDEHRFNIGKRPKNKKLNGTRMNTDKHG
jgi:hypothetical protein